VLQGDVPVRRAGVGLVLEAKGRGPAHVAELAPGNPRCFIKFGFYSYNNYSKGGSAEWSGRVRVGDRLITVDGNDVSGRTPSELSQIITGPDGSKVHNGQTSLAMPLSKSRDEE
jgi:C-terminal processing protease CtpA/Prc